jgi:hypothetical protein
MLNTSYTIELNTEQQKPRIQLYGLIWTASHTDMQKIRIIALFFASRLHGQFEVERKILQTTALILVFIDVKMKY